MVSKFDINDDMASSLSKIIAFALCAFMLRGWWNTVKIILVEISSSMKPYPSVFCAYASKVRTVIGFVEPKDLDDFSNHVAPTFKYVDSSCLDDITHLL